MFLFCVIFMSFSNWFKKYEKHFFYLLTVVTIHLIKNSKYCKYSERKLLTLEHKLQSLQFLILKIIDWLRQMFMRHHTYVCDIWVQLFNCILIIAWDPHKTLASIPVRFAFCFCYLLYCITNLTPWQKEAFFF